MFINILVVKWTILCFLEDLILQTLSTKWYNQVVLTEYNLFLPNQIFKIEATKQGLGSLMASLTYLLRIIFISVLKCNYSMISLESGGDVKLRRPRARFRTLLQHVYYKK